MSAPNAIRLAATVLAASSLLAGCTPASDSRAREERAAAVRANGERLVAEGWNEGRLDRLGAFYAENVVRHVPERAEPVVGLDANREYITLIRGAFPDLEVSIERLLVEGDWMAIRWSCTGTHDGDLPGLPATGRSMSLSGQSIVHVIDGRAVEIWDESNILSFLQQLGAAPPLPPAAAPAGS